jgi:ketosteroid isomerase-like protein
MRAVDWTARYWGEFAAGARDASWTMSQENVEIWQRFPARKLGDIQGALELVAEDVVVTWPEAPPRIPGLLGGVDPTV